MHVRIEWAPLILPDRIPAVATVWPALKLPLIGTNHSILVMFHLRPIRFEIKIGAVVQVVTADTNILFRLGTTHAHLFPKSLHFGLVYIDITILGSNVRCATPVAVFTTISGEVWGRFQVLIPTRKRIILLRFPARDVATEAFWIELSR